MIVQQHPDSIKTNKVRDLFLSLIFDAIGMLSFTIPFVGEFSDVIWAPTAAFLVAKLHKGTLGRVGSFFAFVEEFLPFSDVIPTFTLLWFYKYFIKK